MEYCKKCNGKKHDGRFGMRSQRNLYVFVLLFMCVFPCLASFSMEDAEAVVNAGKINNRIIFASNTSIATDLTEIDGLSALPNAKPHEIGLILGSEPKAYDNKPNIKNYKKSKNSKSHSTKKKVKSIENKVVRHAQYDNKTAKQELSVLLVDANSGRVIWQNNGYNNSYPASLTKLMTLYLAFNAIKTNAIQWNQKLTTSLHAASQVPSKLGLEVGEKISMRDAIMSLIIKSANDAAVVIAEHIGKLQYTYRTKDEGQNSARYEKLFVRMMNKKAKKLGMFNTYFANPSGLHNESQKTTAVDMAIMASALKRDFPNYYKLFSQVSYHYKGKDLTTTNQVTKTYPGAEGLKTGYTKASGYNLITTVKRDNLELIGVVMGGESAQARNELMTAILDLGIKKLGGSP